MLKVGDVVNVLNTEDFYGVCGTKAESEEKVKCFLYSIGVVRCVDELVADQPYTVDMLMEPDSYSEYWTFSRVNLQKIGVL